jgi:hypothetical protein
MSKPSRRPGRAAREVHEQIRAEATEMRGKRYFAVRDAAAYPAIDGLMRSARSHIAGAMPSTFVHGGRTYFLRLRFAVGIEIFDSPGTAVSLVDGFMASSDEVGHVPGH